MSNDNYTEKSGPVIPIGKQRYAYQCEDIVIEPLFGSANVRGYPPGNRGKEPYPNPEADKINHYDLKMERFTGNSMSVTLVKNFKDGAKETYHTQVSFSDLVNRLFAGHPVNMYVDKAPVKQHL